jgi:mono/diheme cytochrome c family protein
MAPQPRPVSLAGTSVVWDSDTKATNIAPGQSVANFTFNFTNVSADTITVTSVRSSCGCTTAQLSPLPWQLSPGTNGHIGVRVDIAGKSGTLVKTVTVGTDKGSKILTVKITILPPAATPASADADRARNVAFAQADRQAVFHGDCASCHSKPGEGKFGKELYDTDCAICHAGEHRASMVPNLHIIPQTTTAEFWRTWIAYGRPHSLMPAFATGEGGPLTDTQIASLAAYLATTFPSETTGK